MTVALVYLHPSILRRLEGGDRMAKDKTALTLVEKALARRPKRGITAAEIAKITGVNPNTVGVYLSALKGAGVATIVGKEASTGGRPANRYALRG